MVCSIGLLYIYQAEPCLVPLCIAEVSMLFATRLRCLPRRRSHCHLAGTRLLSWMRQIGKQQHGVLSTPTLDSYAVGCRRLKTTTAICCIVLLVYICEVSLPRSSIASPVVPHKHPAGHMLCCNTCFPPVALRMCYTPCPALCPAAAPHHSMTSGAQQALRRTMEIYSNTTRFALACNTSTKVHHRHQLCNLRMPHTVKHRHSQALTLSITGVVIRHVIHACSGDCMQIGCSMLSLLCTVTVRVQVIEPIQSRCAIVRFTKVSDVDILARLQIVIAKEGITATKEGLEAIIFTADGDMRQALNNLQVSALGLRPMWHVLDLPSAEYRGVDSWGSSASVPMLAACEALYARHMCKLVTATAPSSENQLTSHYCIPLVGACACAGDFHRVW